MEQQLKPISIDRNTFLELENMSLKLRINQQQVQQQQIIFQNTALKALADAGLNADEWAIDLDAASFVRKDPTVVKNP